MPDIFISTTTFSEFDDSPLKLLKSNRLNYSLNPHKARLTETQIGEILLKNRFVGLLAGTEPLTRKVLRNARGLRVISRVGVGLDNVDMDAAKDLGIKVFNTPGVLRDAVAELTLSLILNCLRKVPYMDSKIRSNVWIKEMGGLLKGKVLGIIGFGSIGTRVAELARAFGSKVIFHDLLAVKSKKFRQVSLSRLLKQSDIISLHTSGGRFSIKSKEISLMKPQVILINTSRGGMIDEDDLFVSLKSGRICAAGLDVFDNEPYSGKLLNLDNVVLTPHIGSYAKESRIRMEMAAVKNLIAGIKIK